MLSFFDIIIRDVILVSIISILFGFIYSFFPSDFGFTEQIDSYYFSFTTMSSVGYGDFSPKTNRAKIAVMVQQFIIMTSVMAFFTEFMLITNFGTSKNGIKIFRNVKRVGSFDKTRSG